VKNNPFLAGLAERFDAELIRQVCMEVLEFPVTMVNGPAEVRQIQQALEARRN
jgi:hypothetical protein